MEGTEEWNKIYFIDKSIGCNLRIRGHVIYYVRNLNNASIFRCHFYFLLFAGVQQNSLSIQIFIIFFLSLGFGWKPVMHMNVRMNANSAIDTERPKDYNINSDKIVRCGFFSLLFETNELILALPNLASKRMFLLYFISPPPSISFSAYRMNDINDVDTFE